MNLKETINEVTTPRIVVSVETSKGTEKIGFPQLTVGDWKAIKADPTVGFNKWEELLAFSQEVAKESLKGKTKKEREQIQQEYGMKLFRKVDEGLQLAMFTKSLQHLDPDITEDEVDRIISYGIKDREAYVRALLFFLYGMEPEALEEAPLPAKEKEKKV